MFKKKEVVLGLRTTKEVATQIKKLAEEKEITLSALLNILVVEYIKNNK